MDELELTLEEREALEQEDQAWQELEDFSCGEVENHRESTIRTREDLLKSIRETQEDYRKKAREGHLACPEDYCCQIVELLERFYHKVLHRDFPEPLPDWWCYSYEITAFGVELLLNRHEWSHDYGGGYDCRRWKELTLMQVPARMLTTGEFAKTQGVEDVTVRQWIRRGKIRSAVKYGNEWRISSLTRVPEERRNYVDCGFYWENDLPELPEKWNWLKAFRCISLTRSQKERKRFLVTLMKDLPYQYWEINQLRCRETSDSLARQVVPREKLDWKDRVILDNEERQALELYLVGCPEAKLVDPTIVIEEIGVEGYCADSAWVDSEASAG